METNDFNLMDLRPDDLKAVKPQVKQDVLNAAWIGCINHALGNAEIVKWFREETGNDWEPGRMALDRMIDDATRAPEKFLVEFVQWVNVNLWGPIE